MVRMVEETNVFICVNFSYLLEIEKISLYVLWKFYIYLPFPYQKMHHRRRTIYLYANKDDLCQTISAPSNRILTEIARTTNRPKLCECLVSFRILVNAAVSYWGFIQSFPTLITSCSRINYGIVQMVQKHRYKSLERGVGCRAFTGRFGRAIGTSEEEGQRGRGLEIAGTVWARDSSAFWFFNMYTFLRKYFTSLKSLSNPKGVNVMVIRKNFTLEYK